MSQANTNGNITEIFLSKYTECYWVIETNKLVLGSKWL